MRKVIKNLPSTFCRNGRLMRAGKMPRSLTRVEDWSNRRIELHPRKLGLEATGPYQIKGATAQRAEDGYIIDVAVPSYGHSLIEMRKA